VIQTYEATNIIVNDPTTLFWSTICYYTIVVGSQGYFEYGAPADQIKYTTQSTLGLGFGMHPHNTNAMALPSPPLTDIYLIKKNNNNVYQRTTFYF